MSSLKIQVFGSCLFVFLNTKCLRNRSSWSRSVARERQERIFNKSVVLGSTPTPTNDSGDQTPMPVRQALALLLGLTLNSTPSGLASSSRH